MTIGSSPPPAASNPAIDYHRAVPFWSRGFIWHYVISAVVVHVLCIYAVYTFSWAALGIGIGLYVMTGLFGVTLGYHRYFTHRSFRCSKPLEAFMLFWGALSMSGDVTRWVGQHRVHHRWSDDAPDIHSPRHGFNWAHLLSLFVREPEGWCSRDFARDLQRNPLVRFFERCQALLVIALAVALYVVGEHVEHNGRGWLAWGIGVRVAMVWHAGWLVNSVGHTWGYRNFQTRDDSRNNPVVALVSFGEGWHNNHHASQRCAAHGRRWFEFDATYTMILCFERLHLVWDVVHPGAPTDVTADGRHSRGRSHAI